MRIPMAFGLLCAVCLVMTLTVHAQEPQPASGTDAAQTPSEPGAAEKADQIVTQAHDKVEAVAQQVDQSQQARQATAGILQPIYDLAEKLAFPAFHWIAFAMMVTGVVSYALQLVLAKLVVLSKMSISLTEILSDALGLLISVVGLVLTTQAATENSTFTERPAAVLSATGAGVLAGFVFYWWGQKQEVQAVKGRQLQR